MSFVYPQVLELENSQKVGTKQCVALIQRYTPGVGHTSLWIEGDPVFGNMTIARGTAIATFVNGHYPCLPHGNHAAYYLRQTSNCIYVMDQWTNDVEKPFISTRIIKLQGNTKLSDGWWPEGGNNAFAYSIIER